MRGRDAAWAVQTGADLAKSFAETSSLLQTSEAKLATSKTQKLELAGERALSILAKAADEARETLPVMRSEEDEWKFVEKFSSSLTKALRAGGLKLNPRVLDAALIKAQQASAEEAGFSKAQVIEPL